MSVLRAARIHACHTDGREVAKEFSRHVASLPRLTTLLSLSAVVEGGRLQHHRDFVAPMGDLVSPPPVGRTWH